MLISESEVDRSVSAMSIGTLLFSFHGRINRRPYWLVSLAMLIVMVVVAFAVVPVGAVWQSAVLLLLLLIPSIWIGMALAAKRLHDRNKSAGWLVIFYVLPGILESIGEFAGDAGVVLSIASMALSIWALVELGFLRGTPGPNDYGPDPLARA
jgi:uncharacterized membrane protein YhaH (DUF805 family)